jgi:hypothetical protein
MGSHQRSIGRTNIWLTPPNIIADLGPFDLDPCAAPEPRPWPTATLHYVTDGLARPWFGRVWLNPPYSRHEIGAWVSALAKHGNGVALVFARTDTAFFQQHILAKADALFFLHGRLFFCHPDGRRADDNGGAPSVLVAYGEGNATRLRNYRGRAGSYVDLHRLSSVAPMFTTEETA